MLIFVLFTYIISSQSYGQHDTRYSTGYTPDYTYGQTADYTTVPTDQYSQQTYDDRSGYGTTGYGKYYMHELYFFDLHLYVRVV